MLEGNLTFVEHVQHLQQLLRNESFIAEFEKMLIQHGATAAQLEAFNALKELFPCYSAATPLIQPPVDYRKLEKKLLKLFGLKSFLNDISEAIALAERQYEQKTGRKLILFNEARDEIINIQELSTTLFSKTFEKAYITPRLPPPPPTDNYSCYLYPHSSLKMMPLLALLPALAIGFTILGVICMTYWNSEDWKFLIFICGFIFFWCAGAFACNGALPILDTCLAREKKKSIHKKLSINREKILQAFRPIRSMNGYSLMLETFLSHHLPIIDILQSIIDRRMRPGNPFNHELPQEIKYLLFLKLYLKEVNRQQMHFRRTKNARNTSCEQIV